ncbi:MAG: TadE/TadG family type IV pilus assembly protein [Candidatus Limnocylindria bacterium]
MLPFNQFRPAPQPATPADHARAAEHGQALVEFAAVLLPILFLIVGIIQFGLIFGANVTLTNAAREGARAATIAPYDIASSRSSNDLNRCTDVVDAARQSFGIMNAAAPNFTVSRPCTAGSAADLNGDGLHDRWVNGDLTVTLCESMATPTTPCPTSGAYCVDDDPAGCLVQVQLTYHSDIVVPFIGQVLSTDGGGRFVQSATATMVLN